ncbi:MAG: hypothetical protein L3J83_10635 [Proteobacteria bacterium]|nr:hypothetical protein [Pseudomonadota bacterium]
MKSKSLLLICTFIFTFGSVFSQADLYYWGYKTKYPLTADSLDAVLIPKDKNSNISMRDLMKIADFEKSSSLSGRKELLLKVRNKSVLKNQISTEFDLLPVFKYGDYPLIPTGEIVFQPKVDIDYDQIRTYCNNQISLVKQSKYGTFTVKLTDINDLIKISNQIYESGLVEWCEPNFLIEIVKHQVVTPTDPLYPQQYYLNQANNIDINAPEAWSLSRGINNVRVAVIDDGVEAHEDLNGRVVQGFTPTDPNGFGAPANPTWPTPNLTDLPVTDRLWQGLLVPLMTM